MCRLLNITKRTLQTYRDKRILPYTSPSVLDERYLTGDEVCEYLHISPRTLQTLRDKRQIPYTVIRRQGVPLPRNRDT